VGITPYSWRAHVWLHSLSQPLHRVRVRVRVRIRVRVMGLKLDSIRYLSLYILSDFDFMSGTETSDFKHPTIRVRVRVRVIGTEISDFKHPL